MNLSRGARRRQGGDEVVGTQIRGGRAARRAIHVRRWASRCLGEKGHRRRGVGASEARVLGGLPRRVASHAGTVRGMDAFLRILIE